MNVEGRLCVSADAVSFARKKTNDWKIMLLPNIACRQALRVACEARAWAAWIARDWGSQLWKELGHNTNTFINWHANRTYFPAY